MQISSKTATLIALFLILAMAISIIALPTATAQGTRKTYAYIGATPNPVGVNQEVLLHIGITQQLSRVGMGWEGLSATITKPDGSTEELTGITTDATGGTGRVIVPTMTGNYTLQTHFPEQVTNATNSSPGTPTGTTMLASDSEELTLVVQEEPLEYWPAIPLPTEYWTRPIDAQLRDWSNISGNWVMPPENYYAEYNDGAPETAHILWAKQLAMGGLAGELMGRDDLAHSFECGDAYEGKWGVRSQVAIVGGVLCYNRFETRGEPYAQQEVVAVDLHTGEELWAGPLIGRTGTTTGWRVSGADRLIDGVSEQFPNGIGRRLDFGQVFYWDSYNYHGVYGLLWTVTGSTWMAFDALTERWIYTITDVPSGTTIIGANGELLKYTVDTRRGWMALWNSSALVSMEGSWNPHGNVYNASGISSSVTRAWMWNITIPQTLPGSAYRVALGDRVVGSSETTSEVTIWGFSLESGREGNLLFNETWDAPADWAAGNQSISRSAGSIEDGLIAIWSKETQQFWGFSTETGKYLWGPTAPQNYLDYLSMVTVIAYGKLFAQGMSGIMYCYDAKNGTLLWTYEADDPYNQVLWANQWHIHRVFIADGKIYMGTSEHSPVDPKPRGSPFVCVDVETGEEIWRADGLFRQTDWGGRAIIGDSIIATMDTYDQRVYAIGKGPSATTVTAGPEVSVHGSSVLVKGMVTDVSPGTKDSAITLRFPKGVPAVSDENMSEWMLYVYKQFPRPTDAVGVEVVVSVLDPNSNYYEVGRATSDASGLFSCEFTPEVPGKYTVIAEFEGSEGYYGSYAETAINVEEPPEATPAPTPSPAPMTDTYVMGFGIGIIIAIVAVGLLLFLMLRKR